MNDETNHLNVWHGTTRVGQLWCDPAGIIGFRYDVHWIDNGFAISQQLPLSDQEYSPASGKAHQFFVNLLPEADARIHIVRDLKIANSDFQLLKAIGGECAGALSILPESLKPTEKYTYEKLSDEQFKKILQRRGIIFNFNSSVHRPRLSLAGAQAKCPMLFDNGNYFLPEDASPSTHIIKFEMAEYRNILLFEYALTKLAKVVGLPVIELELCQFDKHNYLLIKRYDRVVKSQQDILRVHQEDFCQALGVGYAQKYQQDGGPSFQECYHVIQQVSIKPIEDAENLLRWQIFNVLAGNSDGHAKNLSLIYQGNTQPRLAPFYDLVCTRAIERIDTKLALSVGGEFEPDKVSITHWEKLADECGVRQQYLKKLLHEIAQALLDAVSISNEEFTLAQETYPAVQRIKKIVIKQCKKTLRQLEE